MKVTRQSGAASSTPSRFKRWLGSRVVPRLLSPARLAKQRADAESARLKAGLPHVVEYFHQVDDPYSYLAVQVLPAFCERYDVELRCHLVSGPGGNNLPEPDLLPSYARRDCAQFAPHVGLQFPNPGLQPSADAIAQAQRELAACEGTQAFLLRAMVLGAALFGAGPASVREGASDAETKAALSKGDARQHELKHYAGAMLYYGGEWYWGVDRLYHLEQRLVELGASRHPDEPLLYPRPAVDVGPHRDHGKLTLEVYPSLRSPYTAIAFDAAIAMAEKANVNVVLRPVMPMVMRGVSLSAEKGRYILFDASREAAALGAEGFGGMYDPIGEPILKAFSLYPHAESQGRAAQFISAFLHAAFYDRVNTLSNRGLRKVAEQAGLDWQQAREHLGKPGWEEDIENNQQTLYAWGSWGVPSFRLLGRNGAVYAEFWGQDRLWVVAAEIRRLLAEDAQP